MAGADWRSIINDQIEVAAAEANARSRGTSQSIRLSRVGFSPDVHPYLVRAARARGITIAGYIRRAVMAHVALDLGLEARDLFELDLAIRAPDGGPRLRSRDLDGELYGRWEVQRASGDPRES